MENCGNEVTDIPDEIQQPAVRRRAIVALEAVLGLIWIMPVNMPIWNNGEFNVWEAAEGEGVDREAEATEIFKIIKDLLEEERLDGFVPEGGVLSDREVTHWGGSLCCLVVPGNNTGHM